MKDVALIPFVDLQTTLPVDAFFTEDWHLNQKGNQVTADTILRWISEHPL